MSEFTKGPWHRDKYGSLKHDGDYVVFSGLMQTMMPTPSLEVQANNALITAAPDMYEALELLYDHCRLYHKGVETNNVGEAVRKALAKARGHELKEGE